MSTERSQWRSLGQLQGSAESRSFREREFVEGASEPLDAVSRREVLTLLGASLSLAGLAACRRPEETIVPYVEAPEQVVPGIPRHYATTMASGNTAYGLVVESHEGRPTKIEGNELHPGSLGSSSARVQAAILDLYDPDRSQEVLKDGEASSWEAFVTAWAERAALHAADGGAGLAVLLPPFSSPTLFRLVEDLGLVYPNALVATHAAASDVNAYEGIEQAVGRPLVPVHRLENADVVLCLDADILHADPEMIRNTRGFARRRRVSGPGDGMSRLWAVEPVLSVTGANADQRQRLAAGRIPAFTAALAARLAADEGLEIEAPPSSIPGVDPEWLEALAEDLLAHQGTSLIAAGPQQPPGVHAAALALNAALGNVGTTVEYREPVDALQVRRSELPGLVDAMANGQVQTLLVLGGNPAYDTPPDLGFVAAAEHVEQIVQLSAHQDETAALAHWHLPAAHFLEAWGDARSACGTLSVVQPLILPLYGGKSTVEVLGLVVTGEDVAGYELVRETWRGRLGEDEFESRWRRVLHDGLLPDSATPAVDVEVAPAVFLELTAAAALVPDAAGELELLFRPCPKLHDGQGANNAWLQELPDAITKVTWDNPLLLSPATAEARGLDDGDVVRLDVADRSLEVPVFRVPGMADDTLVLTLGYGRRAAGRVGTGVGFDAFVVRPAASPELVLGVRLEALGRRYLLAQTQEHGTMEGRHLVREATLEHYRAEPHFAQEHVEEAPLWKEREYQSRPQWGMVIDLNACTGCNACAVACQSENNIPVVGKDQVNRGREMAWIRVDRYFTGEPADAGAVFQPVPCMQCENAPCEQVCPVAATMHDEQGLNVMVYNRCIGTRYCSNNCPYKVRRFNFFNYTKDTPESLKMANNPDVTVRSRGVMEKCTYCVQRLNSAQIDARLGGRELRDGDAKTACQQACPAEAIHFGDLEDLESRVRKARGLDRTYSILGELNSRPRTTYQARLRNPFPGLEGEEETDHA